MTSKWPGAPAIYENHTESNIMVAARDGVQLATDIHRPARNGQPLEGRFPVLLQRTPYDKTRPGQN